MTICRLCKVNYADKKNTHFLTDGIIRSCLNLDGSVEREKGFYFDVSSDSEFMEFNFQRGTSVDKLGEALGRLPTDEEIEKAVSSVGRTSPSRGTVSSPANLRKQKPEL